ncbi:hypothetical protein RFI_36610, partial [Reticulomyxa filosa]
IFFTTAYVKVDKRKILIKMKDQTFGELFYQNYYCLKWKDIQKIRNENVRFELTRCEKKFKKIKPSFKIIWTLFQPIIIGKTKTIKNALTFYFLISKFLYCKIVVTDYCDQNILQNMTFIFHFKMFLIYTLVQFFLFKQKFNHFFHLASSKNISRIN